MDIIDFVGYTFSSAIIIVWVAEKAERVIRNLELLFGEKFDEAILVISSVIPKKKPKEHDELEV